MGMAGKKFTVLVAAGLSCFLTVSGAQAAFVDTTTNEIVANGGALFVRFDGETASHSSNLILENTGETILNNQVASVGAIFNIGSFAEGDIVRFRLDNLTTGFSFLTGLGLDSDDGLAHARLTDNGNGSVTVGFEDLFLLGDQDFDDLVFTVLSEAAFETPLPAAAPLLLSGLAGFFFASRSQKQRK